MARFARLNDPDPRVRARLQAALWANRRKRLTRATGGGASFTLATLFENAENGFAFDASATNYQDVSGVTPITTDGQKAALVLDLSPNGKNLSQPVANSQPTYNTNGAQHWFSLDGIDDFLYRDEAFLYAAGESSVYLALRSPPQRGKIAVAEGWSAGSSPVYAIMQTDNVSPYTGVTSYIRNNNDVTVVLQGRSEAAFDGSDHVVGVEDYGSLLIYYVDGIAVKIRDYVRSGSLTLNRFSLGALLRNSIALNFTGRIYAGICIDRTLSYAERANINSLLADRQGRVL